MKKPKQKDKFIEAAKAAGTSEDPADFERLLGGIAKAPPPETVQDRKTPKAKKSTK